MMIAAVILYLIRPNSLRRREGEDMNKSSRDDVREAFKYFHELCKLNFNFSDHQMIQDLQWLTDNKKKQNLPSKTFNEETGPRVFK